MLGQEVHCHLSHMLNPSSCPGNPLQLLATSIPGVGPLCQPQLPGIPPVPTSSQLAPGLGGRAGQSFSPGLLLGLRVMFVLTWLMYPTSQHELALTASHRLSLLEILYLFSLSDKVLLCSPT